MINKKTICFFNSANAWGGGEKWHYDISNLLHKRGFLVKLAISKKAAWRGKVNDANIPYNVFSISNLSFLNPFKILQIALFLKSNNTHTIIINLSKDLKVAGIAAKLAGVKNIIYRRGSAIPIKDKILNRLIFKHIVSEILANSEKTKQTINENNQHLFPKNKIHVIYNGFDIKEFSTQNINKIYTSERDEIVIGNIGRIVEQKAQDKLLELATKLKKQNINFKIIIGGEGKLLTDLKIQAKQLELENHIIFTGFVKDVKSFLESIDLFILTSKWEGFGYVLVEAMACRKPVIAFDISSNPEIIDDKKTGFLIKPFNIEELAKKVIEITNNKILRNKLGDNGYNRTIELFSIEKTLTDLLKLSFINECNYQK